MTNYDKERILSYKIQVDSSGLNASLSKVTAELNKLNTHVEKLMGDMSKKISGGITNLGNAFAKFNQVQGIVAQSSKTVTAAVHQLGADSAIAANSMKALNAQVTSLNTRSTNLGAKLATNTAGVKNYAVAVNSLTPATNQAGQSFSKMGDHLRIVNGMFDESTRVFRSAKNDLLDLARVNAMFIATFAAGVGIPTKFFGDFEKELLTLRALGDFSNEQLAVFSERAKDVSLDIGQMSKDVASAGVEMLRLGLSAEEVNTALKSTSDAALANSISIVRAAEIGVTTTKAFGFEMSELENVLDTLTKTAITSASDMESLAETFKYAAPIASSAGNSINELAAATAILSQRNIRASQAGTTLRTMYTRLQRPVGTAKELLDKMKITLTDANGQMLPLLDITQQLGAAMDGMSKDTKNAATEIIFGKYALSGATALINAATKEVAHYRKETNDTTGANRAMADEMRQGVNYEMDRMRASLANAAIEMGEAFAPAVIWAAKKVTELSEAFQKNTDAQNESIANMVLWTGGLTGAALAIGTTILAVRTLVGALKTLQITAAITSMFGALTAAILEFKIGMTLGLGATTAATTAFGAMAATVGPLIVILGTLALTLKNVYDEMAALWKEEQNMNSILESQIEIQKKRLQVMKDIEEQKKRDASGERPTESTSERELGERAQEYGRKARTDPEARKEKERLAQLQKDRRDVNKLKTDLVQMRSELTSAQLQVSKTKDPAKLKESQEALARAQNRLKTTTDNYNAAMERLDKANQLSQKERDDWIIDKNAAENQFEAGVENIIKGMDEGGDGVSKALKALKENISDGSTKLSGTLSKIDEQLQKEEAAFMRENKGKSGGRIQIPFGISKRKFGTRGDPTGHGVRTHAGQDLYVAQGTPLKAFRGGEVVGANPNLGGLGGTVKIRFADGMEDWYSHLSEILVKVGDIVDENTVIAKTGGAKGTRGAGWSTGPHLHWQVMKNGTAIDPMGTLDMGGKPQFNKDRRRKELENAAIQAEITRLEGLKKGYAAGSAEANELSDAIETLRNKMADVDADYAKSVAKRMEDLRKKADDYVDKIMNDEIPKLRAEAEKALTIDVGKSFENEVNAIESEFSRAIDTIKTEFSELGDVSELVEAEGKKRIERLRLLSAKAFSDINKSYEEMRKEQRKSSMPSAQVDLQDAQRDLAQLMDQYDVLKRLSDADPSDVGAKLAMNMLDKIKVFSQKRIKDLATQNLLNAELYDMDRQRLQIEEEMVGVQNQINQGLSGDYEMRSLQIIQAEDEIANLKRIQELESQILGGDFEAKRQRQLEHQRALNEAYKTLNALQAETLEGQLKLAENRFNTGQTNTRQNIDEQIAAYDKALNDPSVIANQQMYNTILTARNSLLMRSASYTGDVNEMVQAGLKFLLNSKDLTDDIDWGGYKTNMTEIIDKTNQWGAALADAVGKFSGGGNVINKALNLTGGLLSGAIGAGFSAVTGNPMGMIQGAIDMVGALAGAWEDIHPDQEKVAAAQRDLNRTIIELDLSAAKAAIRVRELRGELTAYQAQLETAIAERKAVKDQLAQDEDERDALKNKLVDMKNQPKFLESVMSFLPGLGFVAGLMKNASDDAIKQTEDALAQIERKIKESKSNIEADEIERAKAQTEQRIDNDIYYQKMKLEVDAETARQSGNLQKEAEIRRNIQLLDLRAEYLAAVKDLESRVGQDDYLPRLNELIKIFQGRLLNIQNASSKEILDSKREENEKIIQFEYDRREHEVYMMKEGIAKKIALINLERDQEEERLLAIEEANKKTKTAQDAMKKRLDNETERVKDLTDAWKEYYRQLLDNSAEAQNAVSNNPLEQIEFERQKAIREARREFEESTAGLNPAGPFDPALLAMSVATNTYNNKVRAANRKSATDSIEFYATEAERIRNIKMLEAENTRDQSVILKQELQNRMDELEDWRTREIVLANGNSERLAQIDREYWAERIGFVQDYQEKAGDLAVKQFNDLKQLRELQFQEDSRYYENAILRYERQLVDYQKARDDLQEQIEYYEGLIADKQRQFDEQDKSLYQAAFANVDLPKEVREGLEAIANPTDVPNSRFSRDTQREAIEKHIELLRKENEALKDYEEISMSKYWEESSKIAAIGGKFYQSLLDDEALMEKMTREEQVDIRRKLSEEYMKFQEAEKALAEAMYEDELKRLDDQVKENEDAQDKIGYKIADKRYQLELLSQKYQDDGRKIEDEIRAIEMAHGDWAFSLEQVRENFEGLITSIKTNYGTLKEVLGGVVPVGVTATGGTTTTPPTTGVGSVSGAGTILGSGGAATFGGRSRTRTGSYVLDGGDGYFYQSTSDMMKYQSKGYADGFMVKNMDKYRGDKLYMGNGMRFDANEALIPLDKFWNQLESMGNNTNVTYDFHGNIFRSEEDIINAINRVEKDRRRKWGMNHGTRVSAQGAR